MSIVNLDDINELIKEKNITKDNYDVFTPQLSSLKIMDPPTNICSLDDIRTIRHRFFHNEFPANYTPDNDLLEKMCNFILGDNVPKEEKNYLSKYFNTTMKDRLMNKYLDCLFIKSKNVSIDPEDVSNTLFYNPRINGVPLKDLNDSKVLMSYEEIKDILIGKEKIKDSTTAVIIKHIFEEESFFTGPWITDYVNVLKEKVITPEIANIESDYLTEWDINKINTLKQSEKKYSYEANEEFIEEIVSSIPRELTILEKTIYVYSKLCRVLSYDSTFFMNNKTEDMLNPNLMNTFDSDNNYVVCHSFAYIFASILRKLGVETIREKMTIINEKFLGHSNITYMVDENVIFADSTREVIGGDLEIHKFTNELHGIRCELYSKAKQDEFRHAKDKVLRIIQLEDMMIDVTLPSKEEVEKLNPNEKYILFNNLMKTTHLTKIDFVSFVNRLINIMDLNIETTLMHKKDDLSSVYLRVLIKGYNSDGKPDSIEYIIDSTTKEVVMSNEIELTEKEKLSSIKK